MKLIDPACYEKFQGPGMHGAMEMMAYAGRLTRNCEGRVGGEEESVQRMMDMGHGRVFEFGTFYLSIDMDEPRLSDAELCDRVDIINFYDKDPYSRVVKAVVETGHTVYHITTNYRVLLKGTDTKWGDSIKSKYANNKLDDLKFMTEDNIPTKYHKQRKTIVWDYGISRVTAASFRTHCGLSTLMMSTRYCNFGLSKFGSTVTFSRCHWLTNETIQCGIDYTEKMVEDMYLSNKINPYEYAYLSTLLHEEKMYLLLTGHPRTGCGVKYNELAEHAEDLELKAFPAERARGVLGLDVATKMIQCGYIDEWDEFFRQRANESEHPHPDALLIANMMKDKIDWL